MIEGYIFLQCKREYDQYQSELYRIYICFLEEKKIIFAWAIETIAN